MLVSPHVLFVHSSSHLYIILYRLLAVNHVAEKEFLRSWLSTICAPKECYGSERSNIHIICGCLRMLDYLSCLVFI